MRKNSVNYDEVAPVYNRRYQKKQRQGTLNALRRILSDKSPAQVLEVGCGTCHWLERLEGLGQHMLVGVDKAHGMLKQSKMPHKLLLCQGVAERIPLKSKSFDFIYCANALHHFTDPENFIKQAERLIRPKGTLAILGMNPRDPRNRWYIYDFFKGTLARDLVRFPDWCQVKSWLEKANFVDIKLRDINFIHDPKTTENVLEDPFLQKNACSQLVLLSQREYQDGLQQLREHIKTITDSTYRYENDIVISMIQAVKA